MTIAGQCRMQPPAVLAAFNFMAVPTWFKCNLSDLASISALAPRRASLAQKGADRDRFAS
jgi:hypothetical protein